MIPKDIIDKVRRIEITTSRLVNEIFAGEYHSVFKGQGMEFDEVREYVRGDDVRNIDWNVTARTGLPHVKKYIEERELSVMILVDGSRSCQFSSVNEFKNKLAAEIAAVLAFSAIKNADKIGLMIFTEEVERFIPPRKGTKHVLRIIREVLYYQPKYTGTNLAKALEYLSKVTTRKSIAFVLSDFFDDKQGNPLYQKALKLANQRHDMVAITLNDPREQSLPNCGLIELQDAETGEMVLVDSSHRDVREAYAEQAQQRLHARERLFQSLQVDHIDIFTDQPYIEQFIRFFAERKKKRR